MGDPPSTDRTKMASVVSFISVVIASVLLLASKKNRTRSKNGLERSIRQRSLHKKHTCTRQCEGGFLQAVGNTKLIELVTLSKLTGCRILGKCEFLNPGGSSKDRIAKSILLDAVKKGKLNLGNLNGRSTRPTIVEGTSGSTGISLALGARALGCDCLVVMPDDISKDKSDLLLQLGANVKRVKPASDSSPKHYVNIARRIADEMPKGEGFFADQFENDANHWCHYNGTGAEIWLQTKGIVDAFISGSGTGGTIAGVGRYLRENNAEVMIYLADPQGSGLANRVNHGILYTSEMQESRLKRHRYDTIVEGVGLCRLTHNFQQALEPACGIDKAISVSDQEAVTMSRWLLNREGLFLGSSSALNCCAALQVAKEIGQGKTIVLLLCDGGERHTAKFWNDEYLRTINIDPTCPTEDTMITAVEKGTLRHLPVPAS